MKYTFVVSVSYAYLFALNCTINAAKYFGTTADFNIIYDDDITQEIRDAYTDAFPFKIIWHPLHPLYNSLSIKTSKPPSRFWSTPWLLASQLLDEYDSICILQADEMLMTNVDSLFRIATKSDVVIATEYHVGLEAEELPFGTTRTILHRGYYALYDQLVFMGKSNKQILIDTYTQQCVEPWIIESQTEVHDPLCAFNQACTTHLSKDRIFGLDCNTWTWDKGAWSRRKLRYDVGRKQLYDEDVRLHGMHTKWWLNGIIPSAIERETNIITKEIIAHNYNIEREFMLDFNEMTPATRNNEYDHALFK
jgi:hypothetical protein